MKKRLSGAFAALLVAGGLAGCATMDSMMGWTPLVDATHGAEGFNQVGDPANWSRVDGVLQATAGGGRPSYLVTKVPYKDFQLRAEFWASDDANSGIFFRCQNPMVITDESCYEANIFDQRPDPIYSTGSIVKVARVYEPYPKAGGKWNTYDITARGNHIVVVLNGVKTIDIQDSRYGPGPIALQWGRGTIKWRKVEIKPL